LGTGESRCGFPAPQAAPHEQSRAKPPLRRGKRFTCPDLRCSNSCLLKLSKKEAACAERARLYGSDSRCGSLAEQSIAEQPRSLLSRALPSAPEELGSSHGCHGAVSQPCSPPLPTAAARHRRPLPQATSSAPSLHGLSAGARRTGSALCWLGLAATGTSVTNRVPVESSLYFCLPVSGTASFTQTAVASGWSVLGAPL